MPFILSFALRNLGRHRRRTMITASALAVGLGIFLMFDSMLQGADGQSERNVIWYEFGGARVSSPESAAQPEKLSLKHPLSDLPALLAAVRSHGYQATPRLAFEAELVAGGGLSSRVVRAQGVDPTGDPSVYPRKDLAVEGQWFGAGEPKVVVGTWLAQDMDLKLGQAVTLTTRTREGSFQVLDLEVSGIVSSPDPILNRTGVFLPLDLAQSQLEMEGMATEISVALVPGSDADAQAKALEAALTAQGHTVRVLSWRVLASDLLAISAGKQKGSSAMLFLVFVIAAVGVGNTMLMTFYERKTEIGMLRALGMPDPRLFWSFLAEAAGIGVIGSILGLVLGGLLVAFLVFIGLDFSAVVRQMDIGYRISGIYYGVWVPQSFIAAAVAGVVLATLCAIGPTRRALRLPITQSLRSE